MCQHRHLARHYRLDEWHQVFRLFLKLKKRRLLKRYEDDSCLLHLSLDHVDTNFGTHVYADNLANIGINVYLNIGIHIYAYIGIHIYMPT